MLCLNCLLKHFIEGEIERTGRRRRIRIMRRKRRRKEEREEGVKGYWITLRIEKLLETEREILAHTLWRSRFGADYGPVIKTYYAIMRLMKTSIVSVMLNLKRRYCFNLRYVTKLCVLRNNSRNVSSNHSCN